ncbi:GIY-YIG nuclease family protein [Paraburkholderia sediminicola]|uniref:GIY-YIG nuclease family protein n=1 Tax=Paraburkholderia sediminicola TaxID=458836 RepID=UPI0038BBD82F
MKRLIELTANSELASLRLPATRGLFLYVMQNEHGIVKIGHSENPERRMVEVQKAARCKVSLIATFPDAGHFEEWVHIQMADFAIGFEWFEGTQKSKNALVLLLGIDLQWAYPFSGGAQAWMERLMDSGAERYWRKREREVIRRVKGAVIGEGIFRNDGNGSASLDGYIAPHVGFRDPVFKDTCNGESVILARFGDSEKMTLVPTYTRSMDAALRLWLPDPYRSIPAYARPVECCFYGLCDRLGFDPERLSAY